jgi:putative MATE family efflux protein|tara:strand:+ start:23363 stop:24760 length:1398 start_codon:yes stop_codon:yes gene_type:complete
MNDQSSPGSRLESFLENPPKALWTLAIPIMFGMGIHTFYNLVDMIFIGRLGGDAITGVAFNMPVFFLMLGLTMGLGSGVTASIARFIGQKNKSNADNSAEHAIVMAAVISIVFTTAGLLFGKDILIILGAEDKILALAWEYLSVIVMGLPFMVFSGFFRSILAGEGDMKFPMMVAGLGTVLNIFLDPIFIFDLDNYGGIGLGMGVKGAALATVISQLIVFIIFIYMLFIKKHAYITFNLKDFSPSKIIIWDIIKVGLPASLSMIIMAIGQGVFNRILIHYSSQTVAAYQVAGRLDMLIFLPIFAIAGSMTTLVGMFYGAKEIVALNRIVKYGIISSFLITLVSSTFVYFFAHIFSSWFTKDQEIIDVSVGFLRLLCLIYPLVAIAITSGRVMQGLGKGIPVLLITIVRVLGVSAPLALYFSFILDKPVEWNWYAMMIAAGIAFLIAISWVRLELNKINKEHQASV